MVDLDAQSQRSRMILFLIFHILGGNVGMLLILFTIVLSEKIERHPVFVNFCLTWIVFSGSYTLLFYAGHIDEANPSFSFCVTQAAMIYGSGAMMGVSMFVFLLHLFIVIRGAVYPNPALRWRKLRLGTMLAAPYMTFLTVFIIAMVSGHLHPSQVHRSSLYCTIKITAVADLGSGVAAVGAIASLIVQVLIAVLLLRHWREIREAGTSLSLPFRTMVFTITVVFALLASIAFLTDNKSGAPNILLACFPIVAFLVFGSQSDLLRAWCFWRKDRDPKNAASTPGFSYFSSSSSVNV